MNSFEMNIEKLKLMEAKEIAKSIKNLKIYNTTSKIIATSCGSIALLNGASIIASNFNVYNIAINGFALLTNTFFSINTLMNCIKINSLLNKEADKLIKLLDNLRLIDNSIISDNQVNKILQKRRNKKKIDI